MNELVDFEKQYKHQKAGQIEEPQDGNAQQSKKKSGGKNKNSSGQKGEKGGEKGEKGDKDKDC